MNFALIQLIWTKRVQTFCIFLSSCIKCIPLQEPYLGGVGSTYRHHRCRHRHRELCFRCCMKCHASRLVPQRCCPSPGSFPQYHHQARLQPNGWTQRQIHQSTSTDHQRQHHWRQYRSSKMSGLRVEHRYHIPYLNSPLWLYTSLSGRVCPLFRLCTE